MFNSFRTTRTLPAATEALKGAFFIWQIFRIPPISCFILPVHKIHSRCLLSISNVDPELLLGRLYLRVWCTPGRLRGDRFHWSILYHYYLHHWPILNKRESFQVLSHKKFPMLVCFLPITIKLFPVQRTGRNFRKCFLKIRICCNVVLCGKMSHWNSIKIWFQRQYNFLLKDDQLWFHYLQLSQRMMYMYVCLLNICTHESINYKNCSYFYLKERSLKRAKEKSVLALPGRYSSKTRVLET